MTMVEASLARLQESCSVHGRQSVTAALPQAASAGIAAYAQGGNAFDAALAACFVETVALPMKCGLAGDVVAMFRLAGGPIQALLSIGSGAASLARGQRLERLGPRSVGIPGAPDGYATLHRQAHLTLSQLVTPAAVAARDGVRWTRTSLSYLPESRELLQRWSPDCIYLQAPQPHVGDVLRLPRLADLLEAYAESGSELFFGVTGEQLVAELAARGGFLDADDLRIRPAVVCDAAAVRLKGGQVLHSVPAPTDGQLLLQAVARLERSDADPASLIAELRATARKAGTDGRDGGTSVVSAADRDGNWAVVVHSNSYPRFGSGIVLSSGLVLNNRPGRGFDLLAASDAPNAPAAGRTPPTTLHAWALEDGQGVAFGATPGGVNQLPWNVQAVLDLLTHHTLAETVTRPRWAVDEQGAHSAEPGARIDARLEPRDLTALSLRSAQQITRIAIDGTLEAAADPRAGARASALY